MQRTFLLVLSVLLCSNATDRAVAAQQPAGDVHKRFAGHWRLVTYMNVDESGATRDAGYESGRLTYDAAGNMTAQLMRINRKPLSQPSTETERAAAYATYVAYYGTITIDPANATVTHHVEGSVNPNWLKTDMVRYYEFSPDGKRLVLSIKNAQGRVTAKVTWERID